VQNTWKISGIGCAKTWKISEIGCAKTWKISVIIDQNFGSN
jgi:hypothetical protein